MEKQDMGYRDRRLAKRLEDPEFREEFEKFAKSSPLTERALTYVRKRLAKGKKPILKGRV